jgi:ubiquinone/menaquinone biosynthesis C-methylase UbiE
MAFSRRLLWYSRPRGDASFARESVMTQTELRFTAGAAYERYMGGWTRAAGASFLDWLAPRDGLDWLDLGCGTGAFTEALLDRAHPASVAAIDPAPAQIDHARAKPLAQKVDFRVADAQDLPFDDASFDVVVSALVLNFIPDRARALGEMRRVLRPGGVAAAYVWDLTGDLSIMRFFARALRAINADIPPIPGVKSTRLEALAELFEQAGLADVAVHAFEVEQSYADFDAYWRAFLDNPTPASAFIAALPKAAHDDLYATVRASLPLAADGSLTFAARAHAVKGVKPA